MRFEFGKNWQSYSRNALTPQRLASAREDFNKLFEDIALENKSFLDIGFGQGLSLIIAAENGARVTGLDIDQDSLRALELSKAAADFSGTVSAEIGSILDWQVLENLSKTGKYDIVHSWGVLHHTGDMEKALHNACALVKDGGYFVCAVYNKHWSSVIWKIIKYGYNKSTGIIRRFFIVLFFPVIYSVKWLVTGKNPMKKARGMDFYHDVIDWVGGYPYEYATVDEFKERISSLNLKCIRINPSRIPTGCNEFVCQKIPSVKGCA